MVFRRPISTDYTQHDDCVALPETIKSLFVVIQYANNSSPSVTHKYVYLKCIILSFCQHYNIETADRYNTPLTLNGYIIVYYTVILLLEHLSEYGVLPNIQTFQSNPTSNHFNAPKLNAMPIHLDIHARKRRNATIRPYQCWLPFLNQ